MYAYPSPSRCPCVRDVSRLTRNTASVSKPARSKRAFDGLTGVRDHQVHQPHAQEPWHEIHIEHHAPAQILRDIATDDRSYRRSKAAAMPYRPMARPRCLAERLH